MSLKEETRQKRKNKKYSSRRKQNKNTAGVVKHQKEVGKGLLQIGQIQEIASYVAHPAGV